MFIYMSEVRGSVDLTKGVVTSLPKGARFRLRGEVGPNDDAVSFKRQMAKAGHLVVLTNDKVGTPEKDTLVATASELGVGHLEGS